MKHRLRNIIIIVLIVIIFIALFILKYLSSRIPGNPPGTVGNTAGNLNNGGLFCEYDGTVFFANTYDGASLYAMDSNEGNLRKLSTVTVQNLLAAGDYLYYFQTGVSGETGLASVRNARSFNRCKQTGEQAKALVRDVVSSAQLVDNSLYIMSVGGTAPSFYKMDLEGKGKNELADYEINPACAANGYIYYNGTQGDHYLYQLNTAYDVQAEIRQGNLWYPVLYGDYIYYMDVSNDYRLCRYSLSQNVVEVLSNDRMDCFNVGSGYVYYQKSGDAPQLICMRDDGTGAFVLAEGVYRNIHITSSYVYFQAFGNDTALYHSPLGSTVFEEFTAALNAVLAAE